MEVSMRVLLALAVVVAFGAMFVFDTAALIRLTVICATGGCGVGLIWIAIGVGGLALIGILLSRRPRTKAKIMGAARKRTRQRTPRKTGAVRKSKPAK